jgi:AraC family transcriptional regulator
MYDVSIKTADNMHLAALSHRGDYAEGGIAFQKLATILTTGGHWPQTRGMAGVYYDDPSTTKVEDLRSHAGVIWVGDDVPDGLESVKLDCG